MLLLALVSLSGCKGEEPTPPVDCSTCLGSELCIDHVDESDAEAGFVTCEALPAECGEALDCSDNTCVADAYALCATGFEGGLCQADRDPPLTCFAEVAP